MGVYGTHRTWSGSILADHLDSEEPSPEHTGWEETALSAVLSAGGFFYYQEMRTLWMAPSRTLKEI